MSFNEVVYILTLKRLTVVAKPNKITGNCTPDIESLHFVYRNYEAIILISVDSKAFFLGEA